MFIHPTSLVESDNIGKDVYIGPFTYISKRVIIEDDCKIFGHVSIGSPAQYKETRFEDRGHSIVIGEGTEIREFVTINLPTFGNTIIGKNCFLMANVHIPHDCEVGHDTVFVVGAAIGGRSKIGNYCYFGLNCSVHNRAELGDYCVVGASSFFKGYSDSGLIWAGVPAKAIKVNTVGIERNSPNEMKKILISNAERALERLR